LKLTTERQARSIVFHSTYRNYALYLVLFLRYSASNNGVTLKSGLKVTQGH